MAGISFEWDERKNAGNRRKHGVSFEEAQSVFLDEHAMQFFDEPHSSSEERYLMLGREFAFQAASGRPHFPRDGLGDSDHHGAACDR